MSYTIPPPPLFALSPGVCAFLHAQNVPVSVAPECCAVAMVGASIAVCVSYAVPQPVVSGVNSVPTVIQLESPVSPIAPARKPKYVSPSKKKKKRLRREFLRLSEIDSSETESAFDNVRSPPEVQRQVDLLPRRYVSTVYLHVHSANDSPSVYDSESGVHESDTNTISDCECEEDVPSLPQSDPSPEYLDFRAEKLLARNISDSVDSAEKLLTRDISDSVDSVGLPLPYHDVDESDDDGCEGNIDELPDSDPRSRGYLYFLYERAIANEQLAGTLHG